MGQITLKKINDDNFYEITKLKLYKNQKKFVASNVYSLVHAYLALISNKGVFPYGIYKGDKPIGFLMIGYDIFSDRKPDPNFEWFGKESYIIWRLMIDKKYQGKGYGKEAVQLALDFVKTFPCGDSKYCWVSYDFENEASRKLFKSFGFQEVKEAFYEGGEMPAVLNLKS